MSKVALALVLVFAARGAHSWQSSGAPVRSGSSPPAATPPAAPDGAGAVQIEPWTGTPEAAVRELRRLSLDGDHPDALKLAGRALLASREPDSTWSEARRAELDYGVGLTLLLAGDELSMDVRADAQSAFASAAALAGPGSLRLDAFYNGALVHLQFAERRRLEIPEVQAAQAAGPGGGPSGAPTGLPGSAMPPGIGDEEQAPDPLDLARAEYIEARTGFVRRLRADWSDADTAANLELIERRLEELDEIEQQREEQEEQQQEGEDSAPSEDGEQQESEDEQEPDDEPEDDSEEGEQGEQDEPEEQEQQEQPPPGDDPAEEQPQEQESEPPPPAEEEGGEPEPPTEQPEPTPAPAEEQHLTREEVVRLLDRLAELEQNARELERALQRQRRIPVERDW